jgi:hypothetical protein
MINQAFYGSQKGVFSLAFDSGVPHEGMDGVLCLCFSWEGSLLAYFPRNLGAHGVGTNCINFQQLLNRKGERTFDSLYDM